MKIPFMEEAIKSVMEEYGLTEDMSLKDCVEKQIPKKLRENDECIGCGNELWMLRDTGAKYCQYCGQAIDWSDEE